MNASGLVLNLPNHPPLSPFQERKGDKEISGGHPKTPVNADMSGLVTPFIKRSLTKP